jgi:FtsP/CotA-like multicopper oxidase with cupredoxin domain
VAGSFVPDVEIALEAIVTEAAILPGRPTQVWSFRGTLLKGRPEALTPMPESYLGPIIRLRKGQKVRIRFSNRLPEHSIVHWHGLTVPDVMDGHPRHAVAAGASYVYEYEVKKRAGTYWYHPHAHGRTGPQVYRGLAGLLIVSDDEEAAAGLPTGEREIPLVLQDRQFDAANQLEYESNFMGYQGEDILVNGRPRYALRAATGLYRLRVLNGSNARIFNLAWDSGDPFLLIGTDGGLLDKPLRTPTPTLRLAPAERADLLLDLRRQPVGSRLVLVGRERGEAFRVLTVEVTRREREHREIPAVLSRLERYEVGAAANAARPRIITAGLRAIDGTNHHVLNGRLFNGQDMEEVAEDEVARAGALELWEVRNETGQIHPIHIHGVQFQIASRDTVPGGEDLKYAGSRNGLSAFRPGFRYTRELDGGWKDTVTLSPGERARLLMRFAEPGLFLYHCHTLEHEDLGMMRNYRVQA